MTKQEKVVFNTLFRVLAFNRSDKELIKDYLNAVPDLTISEVFEVKRQADAEKSNLEKRLKLLEDAQSRDRSLVANLIAQVTAAKLLQGQPNNEDNEST